MEIKLKNKKNEFLKIILSLKFGTIIVSSRIKNKCDLREIKIIDNRHLNLSSISRVKNFLINCLHFV